MFVFLCTWLTMDCSEMRSRDRAKWFLLPLLLLLIASSRFMTWREREGWRQRFANNMLLATPRLCSRSSAMGTSRKNQCRVERTTGEFECGESRDLLWVRVHVNCRTLIDMSSSSLNFWWAKRGELGLIWLTWCKKKASFFSRLSERAYRLSWKEQIKLL